MGEPSGDEKRSTQRERRLMMVCGTVLAFAGLGLLAVGDDALTRFAGSAQVFAGTLLALPQAVVEALRRAGD
jgi:hypothetical protein